MADLIRYLVNTTMAREFLDLASVPTGRKALFGDPDKYNKIAHSYIRATHDTLGSAIDMLGKIARDPTITDVAKHINAKQIADKTADSIIFNAKKIDGFGSGMMEDANNIINETFAPDPNRISLYTEWRGWLKEASSKPDFASVTKDMMGAYPELVSVLRNSPHVLTGLNFDVQRNLMIEGIKMYLPKECDKLVDGSNLVGLAKTYAKPLDQIRQSFYNSGLADQASRKADAKAWAPIQPEAA